MTTLPFIPGFSFDRHSKVGQTYFPRTQILGLYNNVPAVFDDKLNTEKCDAKQRFSVFPLDNEGSRLPSWLTYDKQELCFTGYWQEGVSEIPTENFRIHKVRLIYFLEDDTIQIINCPAMVNTGMTYGFVRKKVFLSKRRIPLPPPNEDQFYNLDHFKIGGDLLIYGRVYRITGCGNSFTENFLRKIGRKIENSSSVPLDPGAEHRIKSKEAELMPLRPTIKNLKLRKFLENDRKVLRFYAYWDDTDSLYGDIRELIIYYFLTDDTMEIKEKIYPNSGQDSYPILLRRRQILKTRTKSSSIPEQKEDFTVLNVLESSNSGTYFLQDPLQVGVFNENDYYKDSDLMIGAVINVLGRKIIIYDCDEYTKHHYRSKYSIDDFTPVVPQKKVVKRQEIVPRQIPPHNVFGSEEDSLQNVLSLTPKPKSIDFEKFIRLNRNEEDSNILRFSAQFAKPNQLNRDRKFVINVYLYDNTIFVYEAPQRNSGFPGGRFIERMKIKKPITPNPLPNEPLSKCYTASDFYIGACVSLNSFDFVILDADEYCLRFMEDHPEQFPQANVKLILSRIKKLAQSKMHDFKECFVTFDPNNTKKMEFESFRFIIREKLGRDEFSEHEIITLARHYTRALMFDIFELKCLTTLAQRELHRVGFDDFEKLFFLLQHYDGNKKGVLDRKDLYRALRSYPVPLPPKLIQMIVDKMEPSEELEVSYTNLVDFLNYKKFPSDYQLPPYVVFETLRLESDRNLGPVAHLVEYTEFFHDLEIDEEEKKIE